jgi:sirohydrochlorin cobaltochelatase
MTALPECAQATVLFAHGSRDPVWQQPLRAVAQRMATLAPQHPVALAFLELCPPDLPTAVAELVVAGAQQVTVVPLFLGMGRHVREDLPRLMAEVQQSHPQVVFRLKAALGEEPELVSLLAELALR